MGFAWIFDDALVYETDALMFGRIIEIVPAEVR